MALMEMVIAWKWTAAVLANNNTNYENLPPTDGENGI